MRRHERHVLQHWRQRVCCVNHFANSISCYGNPNVQGAWIKEQEVKINDGQIVGYQVNLKVTFVMQEPLA